MLLRNSFVVPAPLEEAWQTLLDVERIAPCMPGARVDSVDGDDISGSVTVKLGPISVRYNGILTFVERDQKTRRVVLSASAKDKSGGTAHARIAASLQPDGDVAVVNVVTDLEITGKPAQFGRGVMSDVSKRILDQFASNLADEIGSGSIGSAASLQAAPDGAAVRRIPPQASTASAHVEPTPVNSLDVLALFKDSAKRAARPLAIGTLAGVLLGWKMGRRACRER